jgi:hypothetical protein
MTLEVSTSQIKNLLNWLIEKNDSIKLGTAGWIALLTVWWGSMLTMMVFFIPSSFYVALYSHWIGSDVPSMALLRFAGLIMMVAFPEVVIIWCYYGVKEKKVSWIGSVILYPLAFAIWGGAMWFCQVWVYVGVNAAITMLGANPEVSVITALLDLMGILFIIVFPVYVGSYLVLSLYEMACRFLEWRECRRNTL